MTPQERVARATELLRRADAEVDTINVEGWPEKATALAITALVHLVLAAAVEDV